MARGQDGNGDGDGGPVTFTVGDPQGVDSMNPLVGVTAAAYEAWNIQYATLTDKAAADFAAIPGLAESWEGSEDGRTWTYTMRPNLKWSDGQPLTAEDVAYTINRSRDEEWINHTSVVANLRARAVDDRTLVVRTSVPDPKLPTLDVYILPKHIWSKFDEDQILEYDGNDGVGSGPFVLERLEKGQFARFRANPNYWGGRPAVDRVVLRKFNNPDAMVAALKQRRDRRGARTSPATRSSSSRRIPTSRRSGATRARCSEIAINGGDGLKDPHPALLDIEVRRRSPTRSTRTRSSPARSPGIGKPQDTLSVSPNPIWSPEIPADKRFDFDLDESRRILDEAGYRDTDGDGVREMPGGGQPLRFRYAVRSEGVTGASTAEFFSGWMREIGIGITQKVYDDSRLTEVIGQGDYDIFAWGWTPFVDPDQMLSYFTCSQVADDPENPTDYYNDANWCDREYDRLYEAQKVELDPERRVDLVHQMLTRFHDAAVYNVLYAYPDTAGVPEGPLHGLHQQPAETGPVLYSNTSPTYARLKPVSATAAAGGDDGGGGSGALIAIAVVAVALVGGAVLLVSRRRSADERE